MKIHHVGIAVESLAQAVPVFEKLLGQSPTAKERVRDHQVSVATFRLGESRIELLEPMSAGSTIAKFLGKRGPALHHLTLSVPDLPQALRRLEQAGIRLIDRAPRVGAGQKRIAFLDPASTAGVLIELVEEK